MEILRSGTRPSARGPEAWFTGAVRVDPLFQAPPPARTVAAQVTFEPGARTAWHAHPLGQYLIVTGGCGWVQQEGGPVEEVHPGDVVLFAPGERHWHGAAPATAMTHIAILEQPDGHGTDWMEPVSDEQYAKAPREPVGTSTPSPREERAAIGREPTAAQRAVGDLSPKLAELTDQVLFGDVWERPGLSKRDRSLITVATLIALNRPEQLRWHLAKGLENGLTRGEALEAITHLAFYAGWPSAMTAIQVAREVFAQEPGR